MTTTALSRKAFDVSDVLGLCICGICIILLATSFSSSCSLLASPSDFLRVLAPFAIQDTFGIANWVSWVPIVLSLLFFAVAISNTLMDEYVGGGTKVLFYTSAIAVALSVYCKIAVMSLDYVSSTSLSLSTDIIPIMQYGVLGMPVFIIICTVIFCKLGAGSWVEDHSAISWILFVGVMLLLGACAPAIIYFLCLVALWLLLGFMVVLAVMIAIPLAIGGIYIGAVSDF